jgi:hypothetical protein
MVPQNARHQIEVNSADPLSAPPFSSFATSLLVTLSLSETSIDLQSTPPPSVVSVPQYLTSTTSPQERP